ncbi:hypothetical protein TTHERM_000629799 (macronuclear) [Tetrahymena thermophila SB210]|uniref:Transmembrane protein n=1 Tax=Tetrahymena thermophila (strain SB210) TaxID=312017 RepID=W7XHJ6_TETTS|nr:hypothetical protein TTHERM_000629799 [Tetrahymena thermophila SB210]EWS72579.1 hypothetical protein TTHERM_000629799 [Tetrahymena thermophila SB210]|eukprot:XP_012654862.1 hypothetical protein TTHERM_000629799 [Tetrahymena thermophila SB210]
MRNRYQIKQILNVFQAKVYLTSHIKYNKIILKLIRCQLLMNKIQRYTSIKINTKTYKVEFTFSNYSYQNMQFK